MGHTPQFLEAVPPTRATRLGWVGFWGMGREDAGKGVPEESGSALPGWVGPEHAKTIALQRGTPPPYKSCISRGWLKAKSMALVLGGAHLCSALMMFSTK